MGRRVCMLLALGLAAPALAQELPTTQVGSMAPDVFLDDITYTMRLAWIRTITVSKTNPDVAYAGSYSGQVWKTVDGGRTWDESRLFIEPPLFYGDIGERLYFGVHRQAGGPTDNLDPAVQKRLGRRGESAVRTETGGEAQAGGGARGAGANVNFGIGLPGAAPRLQNVVRKFSVYRPPSNLGMVVGASGLNIKQTLLLRGTRIAEVRIIVIHPQNPKIVFACTMFGLYKSYDGGLNWVRTFTGTNALGARIFHLAVDPSDGNKVLLATGEGLYISEDGGEMFSRSTKKGVGEGVIDWIYFNPYDPRYVFIGTDYGLLRSPDGGQDWEWIYFTTFPDGRVVRSIVIDPFDKKTGYIATHDGLYTTPDILTGGLESWKRFGGLALTGIETSKIAACPKHKGHLWTLTNMKLHSPTVPGKIDSGAAYVLETVDGGENWNVIFAGTTYGSMQWFDNDPRDPDLLWLAWSRSMSRMKRRPADAPQPPRAVIPDDPPIGEVLTAAWRYTGIDPATQYGYRWRSRLRPLVPKLTAQFFYHRWSDFATLHDALYPTLPFMRDEGWLTNHKEFRVLLMWDLGDLMFTLDQTMFGRVDRLNYELRSMVFHAVQRMYGELRRLRMLMATDPPKELRVRLMYKLRIEELTSQMDFITGNYLTRWRQGDRPRGSDTKWWEPWKAGNDR